MGFLIIAIIFTFAVKAAWDKGKREYSHTRDSQAAEISRAHPGWSPGKVQRHAKRRARGYWWDQIRHGLPDLKAAYEEDRLVAEAERSKAALDGEKRRKDLRDQIRAAIEEAHRLREEERNAENARRSAPKPEPASEPSPGTAPQGAAAPETAAPPDQPAGKPAADTVPDPEPTEPGDRTTPQTTDPEPAPERTRPMPAAEPAPTAPNGRKLRDRCEWCSSGGPIQCVPVNGREADLCTPCADGWKNRGTRPPLRSVDSPAGQPDPASGAPNPSASEPSTAPSAGGAPMSDTMAEAVGYEQILASYDADIERRAGDVDHQTAAVARLEANDAGYEQRMAMLRSANADDTTIEQVAALREANEQQITVAREAATAAHDGLTRAVAARDDWVSRHGAVHDAKTGTGARGDELLYT